MRASGSEPHDLGPLTGDVLGHLWRAGKALTPGEVRELLEGGLAYTTVMTVLTRLWKRGLLEREPRGRAYAYRPTVSEAQFAAARMGAALEQVSDRATTLSHFVRGLSEPDELALRSILEHEDRRR